MSQTYEDRMLRVLTYIYDNIDGDLSLDRLADVAAMSRFHWHRVFCAMTGETCAQAVRRMRLYRAACWLVQSDRSVDQIAHSVGYPNTQSFERAFRQSFGATPLAFRKAGAVGPLTLTQTTGGYDMYPVEIKELPKRQLAALSHTGPYIEIGSAFKKLFAMLAARDLISQTQGMIGIYYDDPDAVAAENLRSQAAAVMAPGVDVPDGTEAVMIAGGPSAVLTFKGPYAGLKAAYTYLYGEWLPQSGKAMADAPCYEIYLNSPTDTAPEDLLTEICVPLAG